MIPYAETEHYEWYWLWVDGPDGLQWMLARRQTRWPDGFMLPDDGGDAAAVDHHGDGSISLRSKWKILLIRDCPEPVEPTPDAVDESSSIPALFDDSDDDLAEAQQLLHAAAMSKRTEQKRIATMESEIEALKAGLADALQQIDSIRAGVS